MKTVFLSMLAIAALASCSRQDFIDPNDGNKPGPGQGESMMVEITINGGSLSTKAGTQGTAANQALDKTINDLTVFGVDAASGAIITKEYFDTSTPSFDVNAETHVATATFSTTTQTTKLYVIANIGENLVTSGKTFFSVGTLSALMNEKASLVVAGTPKQQETSVLMSGDGEVTQETPGTPGVPGTASAEVSLNFIGSKIILSKIKRGMDSQGVYETDFVINNASMTHVNAEAYYMVDNNSYVEAIAGGIRDAITPTYVTGMPNNPDKETTVADFIQPITIESFDPNDEVNNIAYWYVFENPTAATKYTTLQIEYECYKHKDDATMTKMYFPILFGGGDKNPIKPGQAYEVNITLNGNFTPGGGGGGTDTPDVPLVPTDVAVTVTPTDWSPSADGNKDF